MKIRDVCGAETDRMGQDIAAQVSSKDIRALFDWLWEKYGGQGYKFVMVFDVSGDEYAEPDEFPLYFMDSIINEVAHYSDVEWRDKSGTLKGWQGGGR